MTDDENAMKQMVAMIQGGLGRIENDQDFWNEFTDDSFHTNVLRGQQVTATQAVEGIYITLTFCVEAPTPEVEFFGSANCDGACKPESVFSISMRYGGGMNQFSCAVDVNEVGRFSRRVRPLCEKILAGRRTKSGTTGIDGPNACLDDHGKELFEELVAKFQEFVASKEWIDTSAVSTG